MKSSELTGGERILDRARYHLFLAAAEQEHTVGQSVRTIFDRTEGRSQRIRELYNLSTTALLPFGINLRQLRYDRNYDASGIPFETSDGDAPLIAHGGINAVFFLDLETPDGQKAPHVLKMDSKTLSMSEEQRVAHAQQLQRQDAKVKEWFVDTEGFVIPSGFIIGEMPYNKRRAVGIVQPYVQNFKGVFEDYTDQELVTLFAQEPTFRQDFVRVTNTVQEIIRETGETLDLPGARNLSIKEQADGSHRLLLIESELVNIRQAEREGRKLFLRKFHDRLGRLEDLKIQAEQLG